MKSLRKTVLTAAMLFLLASFAAMNAQQPGQDATPPPPQGGSQTRIRIPVDQVIVPVTVKDSSGRLVADLRRDEFRIFEDNIEQKVASFQPEAVPLSMVLLIDNDLKSRDAKQVTESLRAVVAGLSANDETFVCRFDQRFHEGKGFISDQDRLLTELKRTHLDDEPSAGPSSAAIANSPSINGHSATGDAPNIAGGLTNLKNQPTKALDDAVYAAAQLLKDRDPERQRRKNIFLISDGENGPKFNVNNYDTVMKEMMSYNITVYGFGVCIVFFDRLFDRLSKYSHDTGGDVYYGLKSRAMEELYAKVTEEARNQYTLAYSPSGPDRGAEYHSIEVRAKREGMTIL